MTISAARFTFCIFAFTTIFPFDFAKAICLNLRGAYRDCQIVATHPHKFSFAVAQRLKGADQLYTATVVYKEKPLSVSFLADAAPHPLVADGGEALAPVELTYVASCDPTALVVVATSKALGDSAAEKFTITRGEGPSLQILNETLVLGKKVQERRIECKSE